jgi:hypothetical protein
MNRRSTPRVLFAAALLLAAGGCARGAGPGHAGSTEAAAVRLSPDPPNVNAELAAVVDAAASSPAPVVYRWYRNGAIVYGAAGSSLDPGQFRKGDRVSVEVEAPGPGGPTSRQWKAEAVIGDAPPVVNSVVVRTDPATGGAELEAAADCLDPDGDPTTTTWRWYRNGSPVEGVNGPRLPVLSFARGDRIAAEAVASDGELQSAPRRTEEFVFGNRAPRFDGQPAALDAGDGTFRYRGSATDPDGDPLAYRLEQAPDGMTISKDGTLEWAAPAPGDRVAECRVTVRVTDPMGGEASRDITIRRVPQPDKR